ncbi:MAG: hypothetical protein U9Q16_02490 [Patescibacteria group bacterium]|nr:hypothetical protein [Patescibacteria group bacterium]
MEIDYGFSKEERRLLRAFKKAGIIKIGKLTQLRDGSMSPIYINMRDKLTDDHPELLSVVGNLFVSKLVRIIRLSKTDHRQVVVGVPDAGHPLTAITATMAQLSDIDISCLIQRKIPKLHGISDQKGKFIIGEPKANREYYLIDDVITTSKSKRESIAIMEEEGFPVKGIIVFFDREQGGGRSLMKSGYEFHPIFKLTEVVEFFFDENLISEKHYKKTLKFIRNNQVE